MSSLLCYDNHIILDSVYTWHSCVRDLLTSKEDSLRRYLDEKQRIDYLMENDVYLRDDPPNNPYQSLWDDTAEQIQKIIHNYPIVGFHCTRLIQSEIMEML